MCVDRRSMFEVVDMSGKTPQKIMGINWTSTQFALTLVVTVFAIIAGIWTTSAMAYNWMEARAEQQYRNRIKADLSPPSGDIYVEVDKMIAAHKAQTEMDNAAFRKEVSERLTSLEIIGAITYEAVTGKPLPNIKK